MCETIGHIQDCVDSEVVAFELSLVIGWDENGEKKIEATWLRDVSGDSLHKALCLFSREYDNGFGGQRFFGTIWYADGTWSTRGEYDGSEWWEYNKCPPLPKA